MIDDLLTKPYEPFARGPESFDCWGLCYYLLRQQGYDVPEYPIDPADKRAVLGAMSDDTGWVEQAWPSNDCVVLMGRRSAASHCGIYHNGRVAHCTEATGVIIETVAQLRARGLSLKGFYKWRG